jgi:hypothetical protein
MVQFHRGPAAVSDPKVFQAATVPYPRTGARTGWEGGTPARREPENLVEAMFFAAFADRGRR